MPVCLFIRLPILQERNMQDVATYLYLNNHECDSYRTYDRLFRGIKQLV